MSRIKEVKGIEDFDNSKILVDTHDKLPDHITLKNVVMLTTCAINDDGRFYPQLFLKKHCLLRKHCNNMWRKDYVKEILVSEKELSDINFERLKNVLAYVKSSLIDSDDMYLTVDSLIGINNIIIGPKNVILRKVILKPCGYIKMYLDKNLIEDKLYKLVDQFNKRTINHRDFCSTFCFYFCSLLVFRGIENSFETVWSR